MLILDLIMQFNTVVIKCNQVFQWDKITICIFDNVPPGTYAIAVVHDTNGNGRADTNFLGMPTEGVGVSNNVMPRLSVPSFDANKFSVAAGHITKLAITLRY